MKISAFQYSPYSPGHHLEIIQAAFAKSGIQTKFVFYPPARVYMHALHGDVAGTTPWVYTKERNRDFYYSKVISSGNLVFFHLRKKKFHWISYRDLKALHIGLVLKNHYGSEFHRALKRGFLNVQYVPRETLNFEKLLKGRIDLFPINQKAGYYIIRKYFPNQRNQFTHHSRALKTSPYHLLFTRRSPGSPRLLRLFNQGLDKLKKSSEYNRILKK